jgi:hypothetical protein
LNVGSIVVRAGSLSAIPGKMATLVALIACILRTFFGKMVRVAAFTTGSGGCRLLILPNGVTGAPIVIGRSIAPSVAVVRIGDIMKAFSARVPSLPIRRRSSESWRRRAVAATPGVRATALVTDWRGSLLATIDGSFHLFIYLLIVLFCVLQVRIYLLKSLFAVRLANTIDHN